MRRGKRIKHVRSSGNVFADVGLPDEYLAKAELVAGIQEAINRTKTKQIQVAHKLGIDQPRVSALLNGRLDLFSMERLMQFARKLGNSVEISVRPSANPTLKVHIKPAKVSAELVAVRSGLGTGRRPQRSA